MQAFYRFCAERRIGIVPKYSKIKKPNTSIKHCLAFHKNWFNPTLIVVSILKYRLVLYPDVYSFHVDRSPIETDTFLCTYHGAASDIVPNDQVEQKVLIPEIREKLKALHDGPEAEFESFLAEYFFDLHYQPKPNAQPINLGIGHLWRLAVDHPTQKVLPCVHRAPVENDGEYRLLLIC